MQRHALVRFDGPDHGVRIIHLNTNHLDLRPHRLDVVGHAGYQPAAANSDKHRVKLALTHALNLSQYFHGNRALAGNHIGVVKGVHKSQPLFFLQHGGVQVSVRVTVAVQQHLAAQCAHRVHLELGRGRRHDDHCARTQLVGTQCHTLRMVAGRGTDHALFELRRAQLRHLVVSAAQLEAEHRLLVFTLEKNRVFQAQAQVFGRLQSRLDRHVIDACREDFFQVVSGLEFG